LRAAGAACFSIGEVIAGTNKILPRMQRLVVRHGHTFRLDEALQLAGLHVELDLNDRLMILHSSMLLGKHRMEVLHALANDQGSSIP
jgi:hypothetical protein